ncbi:MAG: HAMP domain-containing histidine kinase [Oscillospiraceae bacterium]|jgi:signal transduction histidine kinase|nr:HAMP domain-containing histidine kinase [Oscillospiraceae bacterium]
MSSDGGRGGRSIARRLSRKLFFRLFWIFAALNFAIVILSAAAAAVYCETRAGAGARLISSLISSGENAVHDDARGFSISSPPEARANFQHFRFFPGTRLSRSVSGAAGLGNREIDFRGYAGQPDRVSTFHDAPISDFGEVYYNVYYTAADGAEYKLSISLTAFLTFYTYAFALLLLWELITLIGKSSKNKKMLRRALEPITELTRAAETLGRASANPVIPVDVGSFLDKKDLTELSGALDLINAARLDTRIDIDGTQRELRELASAINGMLDRVNEAYLAQVRFVSDASHELRTPISVIQGYASMLDRWGKNDEKTLQESIDAIRAETDSMKALVEQLLFLARGENHTIQLEPSEFDLSELAEEITQETRLIDSAHEFRVLASPVIISADRPLIKQAARILIDNAIKYTDPGGLITVRASSDGGYAALSVTDTGVGIPAELLPKIFDRFVRADESRARSSGGAGLGLAIAKWIVSRHGGYMDALSRVGAGTRITIFLPEKTA